MSSIQDRRSSVGAGSVSLILPQTPGSTLADHIVAEYRRILEEEAGFRSVEVIISSVSDHDGSSGSIGEFGLDDQTRATGDHRSVQTMAIGPSLVRAGLGAATGEHLVVLDVNRHYSPESLLHVIGPVSSAEFDLAVAVPRNGGPGLAGWARSRLGLGADEPNDAGHLRLVFRPICPAARCLGFAR